MDASGRSAAAEDGATAELPRDHSSPRAARALVREALDGADAKLVASVELLVSELVTNSIIHASSAVVLRIEVNDGCVRVEVHDADPRPPQLRPMDLAEAGGRGLHLVDQLATRWGHEPDGDGKVVWFELDRTT